MQEKLEPNRWVRAEMNFFVPVWRSLLESSEEGMRRYYFKSQQRREYSDEELEMMWRRRNLRMVQSLRTLREKFNRIKLGLPV